MVGGAVGTSAREALSLAVPAVSGFPAAIFGINLLGAFLLGLLLTVLARRGPDVGRRRRMRILLGTGVLGGFTTYSALAVDTASLLGAGVEGSPEAGSMGTGIAYALLTLIFGGLATWAGIALGVLAQRDRGGTGAEAVEGSSAEAGPGFAGEADSSTGEEGPA